ncbi:hypothetical protein GFB57_04965 [Citrobacter sp. S39]|uniref:hypothetical protein n=1 Tax=Citrobacter TaxID=544 RepID=UPI0012A839FA|nr:MULTISPECIES: hypothetical protein [Citrobacter]MDX7509905.1 hypothetical protein [Citrobacter freundii]QFX87959.1 hypothetical protein GFB57_04965 [Citrobacter sp. S39]
MENSLHSAIINNRRDLRLFLWYLSDLDLAILTNKLATTKNIYNADDIFGSNIEIAADAINQAVRLIKDNEVKRIYTLDFNDFKSLQMPASEFSWVKKTPDACYFTWLFIKSQIHDSFKVLELDVFIVGRIRNQRYPNIHDSLYNKLELDAYPVDNKERLSAIEDFFDRAPATLKARLDLMRQIRNKWEEIYPSSINFPLSPKNKKKCDWAWEYIQKDRSRMNTRRKDREGHYTGEINPVSFTNRSMLSMLRPSGSFEKYMAVKFYFLFMYMFLKDELFIQRFKKAWQVHQYRATSDTRERKASLRARVKNKTSAPNPVSVPLTVTTLTELATISNMSSIPEIQSYNQYAPVNEITKKEEKNCQAHNTKAQHDTPADNSSDGQVTHISIGEVLKRMGKLPRIDEHSGAMPDKNPSSTSKRIWTRLQKAMMEGDKD